MKIIFFFIGVFTMAIYGTTDSGKSFSNKINNQVTTIKTKVFCSTKKQLPEFVTKQFDESVIDKAKCSWREISSK